jgi:hypothetical protein
MSCDICFVFNGRCEQCGELSSERLERDVDATYAALVHAEEVAEVALKSHKAAKSALEARRDATPAAAQEHDATPEAALPQPEAALPQPAGPEPAMQPLAAVRFTLGRAGCARNRRDPPF